MHLLSQGSVPKLDQTIPTASSYFRGFDGVPVDVDGHTAFVHLHRAVVLTGLPIPEPELTLSIA